MILLACPECHRQYDVTHLDPGSKVRCVCDRVVAVKVPRQLSVTAQKCKNCGGSVEPGHAACPYCGSELSKLDLAKNTLCPECFTRLEDDAQHCKACGIAIEPQALTPIPHGAFCPRCKWDLRIRSLADTSVIECSRCDGIWVRREHFEAICRSAQNRPDIKLAAKLLPISAAEPERRVQYIPCLVCAELMLRKMFRYKGQASYVITDYCRTHGVWLDKDELERIVQFIRKGVDMDLPFDVREALGSKQKAPAASLLLPRSSGWTAAPVGWGSLLLLGALGDILGAFLGELLD